MPLVQSFKQRFFCFLKKVIFKSDSIEDELKLIV